MRPSWRTPPLVVILAALLTAAPAAAAPGDLGTEDFSYAPATGSPTESKPESKLWFADGSWWGDLYSPAAGAHRIHRLDPATDRWVDTGTTTDTRRNANSDVLWHAASRKLYIGSHIFSEVGASTPPAQSAALYRFSYDPSTRRYTLDQGYPVVINGAKMQALVIDMDSLGRLWAAWQQDGSIWVNHTEGDDAHWGTPYTAWASPWLLKSDDVAGLVPFGGDKVGILFSYEFFPKGWNYLLVHRDGAGDGAANWAAERLPDIENANNHVNLKADGAGRLFAAVKRHSNDPAAPRIQLLRRDAAGRWSYATFGSTGDGHTRPIVVLQDPGSQAHVFATCPRVAGRDAGGGGDICEKTSSTDAMGFAPGNGTPVLQDADSAQLNDVTSTKQPVNAATGLLLLANNPTAGIDAYWHRLLPLGGPQPPAVAASFAATRDAQDELTVRFIDTSAGAPTSWHWDFGDGTSSNARHGTHRYAQPGTYTVTLTAASATSTQVVAQGVAVPVPVPAPARSGAPAVAAPVRGAAPGRAVQSVRAYRPVLSLRGSSLSHGRVRLSGSVSRRLTGVRIVLQRRTSKGRWTTVTNTRLLALSGGRSRYAFVLHRRSQTTSFRVVLPGQDSRLRAESRALRVRGRS
jgi:PKD repeat protein